MNQPYVYIYPHILSLLRLPPSHPPYPTPLGGHKALSWSPSQASLLPRLCGTGMSLKQTDTSEASVFTAECQLCCLNQDPKFMNCLLVRSPEYLALVRPLNLEITINQHFKKWIWKLIDESEILRYMITFYTSKFPNIISNFPKIISNCNMHVDCLGIRFKRRF